MKVKWFSKIKVTALLMGFIVINSTYAQDASSTSHEEHHPVTQVLEKKNDMPMENGMMKKMDMKSMMGMMKECKEMHKDESMCNQNMMEKCQMQMDKKDCQEMMKTAKTKSAKK